MTPSNAQPTPSSDHPYAGDGTSSTAGQARASEGRDAGQAGPGGASDGEASPSRPSDGEASRGRPSDAGEAGPSGAAGGREARVGGHPSATERERASDGTLVLGGAAAAEGRTTGPNPRIAGPAMAGSRPSAGGREAPNGASGADSEGGRHFRAAGDTKGRLPRWAVAAAAVPVGALALLVGSWAIDTAALSGQVPRNVEVAGRSVGGLGEESLPDVMTSIGDELATRPVQIVSGDETYKTTAGGIGLALDEEATAKAALDADRGDSLVTRPFAWLGSFFSPRDVAVRYTVSEPTATARLQELQAGDFTNAQDPTIKLTPQGWVAVPGTPGKGVDTKTVVDQLPIAAAANRTGTIQVKVGSADVEPAFTDEEAQALADRANQITAKGLSLTADDTTEQVPAQQLRTWIGPAVAEGKLALAIKPDTVKAALPQVFADLSSQAQDARVVLTANGPSITPSHRGVTCCGADSPGKIWTALSRGEPSVELAVAVTEPKLTTEAAQKLGVKQPVCGNHAWRSGAATTAGPGFTTYYDPGQPRVTNIHRIADIVDGSLVLPGESFSMNGRVGPRTTAKGFVEAGAIREGEHVDEVGGGVSQFATTTFNAAYFCGLPITTYQSHSEYFPRYPRGREATMGYPAPDLVFKNDTPYGILVDTSYTATSVTVTLWSTPYATADQTGITESAMGKCTVVTTTRTTRYPDRPTKTDTFRATYRPGEGETC